MLKEIRQIFKDRFGIEADSTYFSPGRVNIIGEHTDYNGGQVLPFCIDLGISAAVHFRTDGEFHVYSNNFPDLGVISFSLGNLEYSEDKQFANYAAGMIIELQARGFAITEGFDLAVASNLPVGGGLSSSAAFLVLIGKILIDRQALAINPVELAKIARSVENNHIGVMCGIMDQFVIANGKAGTALRLWTDTLDFEYVPIPDDKFTFVLINSNTTRKLVESKYNQRQSETRKILAILQKHVAIDNICDLGPEDYRTYERFITDIVLKKRFLHLVNENHRVTMACESLENQDPFNLGSLINESHASLRDLYEVSSPVLDRLVELAVQSGSLGSRMIGGGFGGSTLNIVLKENLDSFLNDFNMAYRNEYNTDPLIYKIGSCDGVNKTND